MKSIAIYNPISGHGHLDSWCAIFIKLLLESGWKVLAITPDPSRLLNLLEDNNYLDLNRLKVISISNNFPKAHTDTYSEKFSLLTIWKKINLIGYAYVFGEGELVQTKSKKFFDKFIIVSFLSLHFFRYFLFPLLKKRIHTQKIEENSLIYSLRNIECEIENQKFETNIVFHMYLDDLDSHNSKLVSPLPTLKFKWAGIHFSSEIGIYPYYYKHPSIKGIAFLDRDIVNNVANYLPHLQVQYLPDITNLQLPQHKPDIVNLIKRNANGRKIVFFGGIIGLRKNLNLWLNLIDKIDLKKWFFVQIGEIDFNNLNARQFWAVYRKLIAPPENFLLIPSYIPDESVFNAVISVSDIIFAVYKEFKYSSNMITKASFFKKPILVSNKYLMGRRIQEFKIGACVSEDDLDDVVLGLEKLSIANIPASNFDLYNRTFSQEVFSRDFLKFVDELNES